MSGFRNPIIGGGGGLVYPAIHSPNYAAGTAGWTVNKDGSAEFADLTIRGTFNGTDFVLDSSGLFLYNGTPSAANPPVFAVVPPGVTSDPYGSHVSAVMLVGSYSGAHLRVLSTGEMYLADATATTRIIINPTKMLLAFYDSGGAFSGSPPILSLAAQETADDKGNIVPAGLSMGATGGAQVQAQVSGTAASLTLPSGASFEMNPATLFATAQTDFVEDVLNGPKITLAGHGDIVGIILASPNTGGTSSANLALIWTDDGGTAHTLAYADWDGFHITAGMIAAVMPGTGGSNTNPPVPETWHPLALKAGWTVPSGYDAKYRLLPTGDVQLAGRVTGSTGGTGQDPFATLPAGYYGTFSRTAPAAALGNLPGTGSPRVHLTNGGTLEISGYASSVAVTYSLDGITLPVSAG